MGTMHCEEFWKRSEAWMENERHPEDAVHFAACARCRALIADLEMIRKVAALELPEMEPPARVWTSLRAQLEKEGLIRSPRTGWWQALLPSGVMRPALAAAYLVLLIAASVAFGWRNHVDEVALDHAAWLSRAQNSMAPLQNDLNSAEAKALPVSQSQNSDVTATLNRNLAIVDNMISMCEKSVREDPQNEITRDYLYTAYQQKADLLAAVAQSGAEGR
ncbi:MAG TPA: hypothetical protein VGT03_09515 [Candidatus Acidoferrales bacterium]|nr:hypothetical protein [Candidatus Acidoferrales bacterium]